MPAYVLSPAVAEARISNVSPALSVPLRADSPFRRLTGIGSPVRAASSRMAPLLVITPSTGTISPARTSMASPTATSSMAMSSTALSLIRCATLGARSTRDFRSRSARATAKSSSTLPPAYMTATTTPASVSPSSRAAIMDTNAIASTPKRMARRSRIIESRSPTTTGMVPRAQIHFAAPARPRPHVARPTASVARAKRINARLNMRSVFMVSKNVAPKGCSCEAFQGTAVRGRNQGDVVEMSTGNTGSHGGGIDALLPAEIAKAAELIGAQKIRVGATTLLALAVLAGAFIALGAMFATTVLAGADGIVPYGISRLLAGIVFCLGLILVIVGGAELFTGNTLMVMAWAAGRVKLTEMLRAWAIIYVGNFLGAIGTALLV